MKTLYSVITLFALIFTLAACATDPIATDPISPDCEVVTIFSQSVTRSTPAKPVPEENENELIEAALLARANKMENATVTFYVSETGITSTGMYAAPNVTVAVDTGLIPYGSDVLIDWGDGNLQYCRADDTNGDVFGSTISLCVASEEELREAQTVTVYYIPPQG